MVARATLRPTRPEASIDDGLQPIHGDRPDHVFLIALLPIEMPLTRI